MSGANDDTKKQSIALVDISPELRVLGGENSEKEWEDVDVMMLRRKKTVHAVHIDVDMEKQDVLNVFLDRMAAGEVSERMLHLTEEIILKINSADYSAWAWRWRCFTALYEQERGNADRQSDMILFENNLMKGVVTGNPKNYQVWNYRRKVVELRGVGSLKEEMAFTRGCLEFDAKNYHVWGHRQALLNMWPTSDMVRREIMFTVECIEKDALNNSAWTHRAFLLGLCERVPRCSDLMPRYTEMEFVMSLVEARVENEAAWAYLKYLGLYDAKSQDDLDGFVEFCASMMKLHETSIQPALGMYEFYKIVADQSEDDADMASTARGMVVKLSQKLRALDPLAAHRYV